jgi:hypothetical protein
MVKTLNVAPPITAGTCGQCANHTSGPSREELVQWKERRTKGQLQEMMTLHQHGGLVGKPNGMCSVKNCVTGFYGFCDRFEQRAEA